MEQQSLLMKMMTNKKSFKQFILCCCTLVLSTTSAIAQSNYKEATNNFALYTQTGDIKHLENAKKFIDSGYKTRRDSSNTRMNILRAMVFSSIAYADSTRRIKTDQDAIDITYSTLSRVKNRDIELHENEVLYIKQNLAAAHIYKANKSLGADKFEDAYKEFVKIDQLNSDGEDVTYNLALLATKAGRIDDAIKYYQKIIENNSDNSSQHYLELASLYERKGDTTSVLNTLENGRQKFPNSKEILFRLIGIYNQNKLYDAIVPIIDEALKYEPENIELNYLAGFTNENSNNISKAKKYYEKAILFDNNNYEANLALGLIYLQDFLKDENNHEAQYHAHDYLLKANEIKPYEVNTLKALVLFYEKTEDYAQLDRVNLLLNQLSSEK